MFERWRTRRHIRIVQSPNEQLTRRPNSIASLAELPVTEESVQALMEILRANELPYNLSSDALSALRRWSSTTAIATRGLCQLIEEDNKFISFRSLEISDVRSDVKAAIESYLRVAQRILNSTDPLGHHTVGQHTTS